MEASFATNKYCKQYLEGKKCKKKGCNFVHEEIEMSECFIKEKGLDNRDIFQSQKIYAYNSIKDSKIYEDYANRHVDYNETQAVQKKELPSLSYILKKVNLFFGSDDDVFAQDRTPAIDKIMRKTDSEMISSCLNFELAERDAKRRLRGDLYVFNFINNYRKDSVFTGQVLMNQYQEQADLFRNTRQRQIFNNTRQVFEIPRQADYFYRSRPSSNDDINENTY